MMDFMAFALMHGVVIGRLESSGRIVRCATVAHPRSKNGAYLWDGTRGFVFAWDGDAEPKWFNDPAAKPWTEDEKRAVSARREAHRRETLARQADAARKAQSLIVSAKLDEHNYFHFKGLPLARGLVLPDGGLLVPMRSLSGVVQGAQIIRWDYDNRRYDKRMLPGMKAKGAVLRIGSRNPSQTFLCEGYVTGLSIEMAIRQMRLNATVIVCFSASNLLVVAAEQKGSAYIFADNDESRTGEVIAKKTGLPYCMSDSIGEDANDLHARAGLLAVCHKLMEVRRRSIAA